MLTDNSIRNKLLQLEETPPKGAWEHIEQELIQLEEDAPLKEKLLLVTHEAPELNWDLIATKLEDEILEKEILQLETEVPVSVWEKINQELEVADMDKMIAASLLNSTEKAPDEVWQRIEKDLSQQEPAKIIQFKPVLSKLLRIAAVLIFGIATWSLVQLIKKNKTINNPIAIIQQPKTSPVEPSVIEENIIAEKEPEAILRNPEIKNRVKIALKENKSVAINNVVTHQNEIIPSTSTLHYKPTAPNNHSADFAENQYLLVLNESGELIRVSKRISTMSCAKEETEMPVDAVAVLQNRNCEEQIKHLQKQMAYSTATSPTAGYLGINDLINSIEK